MICGGILRKSRPTQQKAGRMQLNSAWFNVIPRLTNYRTQLGVVVHPLDTSLVSQFSHVSIHGLATVCSFSRQKVHIQHEKMSLNLTMNRDPTSSQGTGLRTLT